MLDMTHIYIYVIVCVERIFLKNKLKNKIIYIFLI